MAFDAETTERTVTRDRVMRLRDFLKALPPEQFDMRQPHSDCGSPACVCGWARVLFWDGYRDREEVASFLGLPPVEAATLFLMSIRGTEPRAMGPWVRNATNAQAVAVLDHYLATGEIDWSVAK